jgi:hypothetical protein
MSKKMLLTLGISLCALLVLTVGCPRSNTNKKEFTQAEVTEIQAVLKEMDPTNYRIVLPQFRDNRNVGSQTLGTLPITEVRRVAASRNATFTETGNVQAVFDPNDASGGGGGGGGSGGGGGGGGGGSGGGSGGGGGGGSGGSGGGPGSHTGQTPAKGRDIGMRIEKILEGMDKSQYILLY